MMVLTNSRRLPAVCSIFIDLVCIALTSFPVVSAVFRGSQFAAELLVVGITWYYTHQSYFIQRGISLGNTISSLLLYNGESSHW